MYHGGVVRALARWYKESGNPEALKLAGEIARYLRQPKMWVSDGEAPAVTGAEHAHFSQHFHGCVSTLRGLLEYATAAGDADSATRAMSERMTVRNRFMPRG